MGRKNKNYSIDLRSQSYFRMTAMLSFGQSKREARKKGEDREKIFSRSTYRTYWARINWFISYLEKEHPECTTLRKARHYVPEWLKKREEKGLSAWTLHTDAKALGKLFGITPSDPDYYTPPVRRRKDIKKSRYPAKCDSYFSEARNQSFVRFCKSTGLRRSEIKKLKGRDLVHKQDIMNELAKIDVTVQHLHYAALKDSLMFDVEYFLHVFGKGGKERFSPIFGEYAEETVKKMKETAMDEKVWPVVHNHVDIHSYRSNYATSIYKYYARDINAIPKDRLRKMTGKMYSSEVYYCKKDMKGISYDKRAMLYSSKALGHNRIEIVAANYLRGL